MVRTHATTRGHPGPGRGTSMGTSHAIRVWAAAAKAPRRVGTRSGLPGIARLVAAMPMNPRSNARLHGSLLRSQRHTAHRGRLLAQSSGSVGCDSGTVGALVLGDWLRVPSDAALACVHPSFPLSSILPFFLSFFYLFILLLPPFFCSHCAKKKKKADVPGSAGSSPSTQLPKPARTQDRAQFCATRLQAALLPAQCRRALRFTTRTLLTKRPATACRTYSSPNMQ